eukprot:Lankesteria_metandrocarpae@DN4946_c1_g2_i3.p1
MSVVSNMPYGLLTSLEVRLELGSRYSNTALLVLTNFVYRFPSLIVDFLPQVTEVIVRCLQPSDAALRQSVLHAATSALYQLVKVFPMVTFHQLTQRFAVGTTDGFIVLYDLRTAAKWRVLKTEPATRGGRVSGVTAVAFSEDGLYLGSYSAEDCVFRHWQCSGSGFFGNILSLSGRLLKLIQLELPATDAK